jgi:hypothetical protein
MWYGHKPKGWWVGRKRSEEESGELFESVLRPFLWLGDGRGWDREAVAVAVACLWRIGWGSEMSSNF